MIKLTLVKGDITVGTKLHSISQVIHFLGYACWYPAGTLMYRISIGESLFGVNFVFCLSLALLGFILHIVAVSILPAPPSKKPVEYKIVGEEIWTR